MKYTLNITEEGVYIFSPVTVEPPEPPTDIYVFDKKDIVEGEVSDEVAFNNKEVLNAAIKYAKENDYSIFKIDNLDAYFDVQAGFGGSKIENYRRSIQLPSNFHLMMGDDVHIRVQPNDKRDYALLCAFDEENVTITGGHVWGDRYTHDYDGGDTGVQDLGYGIYFIGVENGVVDGTSANQFTGDGFIISSVVKRNNDGSPDNSTHYGEVFWSKNLIVRNCTFDDNRRNGLALTDCEGALLEDNIYSNTALGGEYSASQEGYSWKGVIPRHAIDLEAIQSFEEDGITLKLTEIITDVIIRNSQFPNNYGDIDFYKCERVEVYGNYFESGSGNVASFNVSIHDNVFQANGEKSRAINIKAVIRNDGSHFVKNWKVYNNTIIGYNKGMQIGGENIEVYNNAISDFDEGIFLLTSKDNSFHDNTLTSDRNASKGYYNYPSGIEAENLTIENETVQAKEYGILAKKINGTVLIKDSSFSAFRDIELRSSGVIILDTVEGTVINKSSNIIIK